MAYLYSGTILRVDLSDRKICKEPTSTYAEPFLGGRGINTRLLYDGARPGIDPLDPANLLIFGVGPLAGTPVPASRVEVTAKSPETGFLGSSSFGGSFGPELKYAGYDHIAFAGKSDKPVYLWVENEQVEIRDATHLWGKDSFETQALLRSELGAEVKVACIGPAGENLVHFATVQHDLGRGAGRTGTGAVMGSKNLKAIVVRGTREIELADPDRYLAIAEELQRDLRDRPGVRKRRQHSTAKPQDEARSRLWDPDWRRVNSSDVVSKYRPRRTGCLGCPMQCKDLYPKDSKGGGGAISCSFYSVSLYPVRNTDLDLMLECGVLAQRYGVDIQSSMAIIAWLMDLYEKGILVAKDTDGIAMEWGSRNAILGMFEKIVHREGLGDVLADGMLRAADHIGRGARDYAYHVKGLPPDTSFTANRLIPLKGMALSMAVSCRGDSLRGSVFFEYTQVFKDLATQVDQKAAAEEAALIRQRLKEITGTEKAAMNDEYEGKPELVVFIEDGVTIDDCLSYCKFFGGSNYSLLVREKRQPELITAGMGVEFTEAKLFQYARRVKNLERAYCAREGLTRELDSLPKRYMDRPIERGDFKGSVLDSARFEEMKSRYYALRGWDVATGIPTVDTLQQTGLSDIAADLREADCRPSRPSTWADG